jgi:hypothetical protein
MMYQNQNCWDECPNNVIVIKVENQCDHLSSGSNLSITGKDVLLRVVVVSVSVMLRSRYGTYLSHTGEIPVTVKGS